MFNKNGAKNMSKQRRLQHDKHELGLRWIFSGGHFYILYSTSSHLDFVRRKASFLKREFCSNALCHLR